VTNNLVNLNQIKKLKRAKMIVFILIAAAVFSAITWKYLIYDSAIDFKIPESSNQTYNQPIAILPNDILSQIDDNLGKPILLYVYTTWCGICKQQLPIINEMARKFQNIYLKVISEKKGSGQYSSLSTSNKNFNIHTIPYNISLPDRSSIKRSM
jgi:thiol-disulfide isomerase/thioredoxin